MKNVLLLVVLLFSGAFTNAQDSFQNKTIRILPQSELNITGDTNISAFECTFDTGYLEESQRLSYSGSTSRLKFRNAVLTLNTQGFDCGNRRINQDFHELIQSDKHPEIYLELKQIHLGENAQAIAEVSITIAGIRKEYQLPIEIRRGEISSYKGNLELNINDFDLEPPKKLFGMIVVKDEIRINFNLAVQK